MATSSDSETVKDTALRDTGRFVLLLLRGMEGKGAFVSDIEKAAVLKGYASEVLERQIDYLDEEGFVDLTTTDTGRRYIKLTKKGYQIKF